MSFSLSPLGDWLFKSQVKNVYFFVFEWDFQSMSRWLKPQITIIICILANVCSMHKKWFLLSPYSRIDCNLIFHNGTTSVPSSMLVWIFMDFWECIYCFEFQSFSAFWYNRCFFWIGHNFPLVYSYPIPPSFGEY